MTPHKYNVQPTSGLNQGTENWMSSFGLRRTLGAAVLLGVGLSLAHTVEARVDRFVNQTIMPQLPTGTPNYSPILNPDRPNDMFDVQTKKGTSLATDIAWPQYVGYATSVPNQPRAVRLEVGAKVMPETDGGVEIDPLYGPKSIHLTKNQLMAGPTVLPMGGNYSMQISEDPLGGDPHVFFGSIGQKPSEQY